jgi:iron complex outermembrane receptor protein
VRTPSRFDRDLVNPGVLLGGADFQSEELISYEAGYRGIVSPALSVSLSAFYNAYDELRTVEASGPAVFPLVVRNNMRGDTRGLEAWGNLAVREWWRLGAGFAVLRKNLRFAPGSRDVLGIAFAGNDPGQRWQLHSNMDVSDAFGVDVTLRRVGSLKSPAVPSFVEADARISWAATEKLEISVDGQNLLHDRHLEFINPSIPPSEIPRSFTLTAHWTP